MTVIMIVLMEQMSTTAEHQHHVSQTNSNVITHSVHRKSGDAMVMTIAVMVQMKEIVVSICEINNFVLKVYFNVRYF